MRPRTPPQQLRSFLGLAWLLAGCSPRAQVSRLAVLSPGMVEEPVSAVLTAAFQADSRNEPADSLWDSDATVVANGQLRDRSPRFAGVAPGGEIAITSSRLEVRQTLVWVLVEYRWLSLRDGTAREGKATILLTPRQDHAGWKIVHAHSSTGQ